MTRPHSSIVFLSTPETPDPHTSRVGKPEGGPKAPSGNLSLSAGRFLLPLPAENAGRGARLSAGTHHQRLNLKFSVADTDRIVLMVKQRMTDLQIDVWFAKNQGRDDITREEIWRVCDDAGVIVRIDRR